MDKINDSLTGFYVPKETACLLLLMVGFEILHERSAIYTLTTG